MNNQDYQNKDLYKKINALGIYDTLKNYMKNLQTPLETYCNNDEEYATAIAAIAIRQKAAQYLFAHNLTRFYMPTDDNNNALAILRAPVSKTVCSLFKNYVNSGASTDLQQTFALLKENAIIKRTMSINYT